MRPIEATTLDAPLPFSAALRCDSTLRSFRHKPSQCLCKGFLCPAALKRTSRELKLACHSLFLTVPFSLSLSPQRSLSLPLFFYTVHTPTHPLRVFSLLLLLLSLCRLSSSLAACCCTFARCVFAFAPPVSPAPLSLLGRPLLLNRATRRQAQAASCVSAVWRRGEDAAARPVLSSSFAFCHLVLHLPPSLELPACTARIWSFVWRALIAF